MSNSGLIATVERITQVLDEHLQPEPADKVHHHAKLVWTGKFFSYDYVEETSGKFVIWFYTADEHEKLVADECQALYKAALSPDGGFDALEKVFSALLECQFFVCDQDRHTIVSIVSSIFMRLPPCPPELPDSLDHIPVSRFSLQERPWDDLDVVCHAQKNLIRLVLYKTIAELYSKPETVSATIQKVLDNTGKFIHYISNRQMADPPEGDPQVWFIVRAYLWTFWQRLKTLHYFMFYRTLRMYRELTGGSEDQLALGRFSPAPGLSLAQFSRQISRRERPANMCTWIVELIANDPEMFGLDFRLLYERYAAVLGQEPTRCLPNSNQACDGKHANNCLRFFGSVVIEQSAHDDSCGHASGGEVRLRWNRNSFASIQGPRAVIISHPDTDVDIRYCLATDRTMAISHVWSHGQGGRPENGINRCLHERYCRIASQLGCNSYWIDTTCIPDDHQLRKEAITQINGVFSNSRVVLVCDKDIMKIDVQHLSISDQEALLAATILSDWNARAWTLLESMKGRRNIYLLCKDCRTVQFSKILLNILEHGRIDMAVFVRQVYHMLPSSTTFENRSRSSIRNALPLFELSEVGSWLSYRPASRPGDDFVIWSLIVDPDKQPTSDATAFWKAQVGRVLKTGYLMSSARRLQSKGLSWAPESPYATTRDHKTAPPRFYRATNGLETDLATITEDGLWARWWTYEFSSKLTVSIRGSKPKTKIDEELDKIRSRFLPVHKHGILLRPRMQRQPHLDLAYVDPGYSAQGTLVAVCASNKITTKQWPLGTFPVSYRWIWKGIYEWPDDVPLPFPRDDSEIINSQLWVA